MNPPNAGGEKGIRDPRQFREDVNPPNAGGKRWTGALDNSGRRGARQFKKGEWGPGRFRESFNPRIEKEKGLQTIQIGRLCC